MGDNLELTVRLSNGTCLNIDVGRATPTECTVLRVKEKLVEECPVDRQRLVYKGRILEDDRTLQDYGIVSKSTLFLVKGRAGTRPPPTNSSSTSSTTASTSTHSTTANAVPPGNSSTPLPRSNANQAGSNPWGGVPDSSESGINSLLNNPLLSNPMAADPSQMQEMMNHPMMQSLLDNPQMMQSMMEMQMQTNPAMRQVMESNPALRQMMNDPAILQQVSQMMRNPAVMQQAMRNQDLAMSNIENMPGGFAALSSMYRDIQQPLEESMQNTPQTSSNNNNRQQFDAGASGSAMPNPWGDNTNSTTAGNNNSSSQNAQIPFSGLASSSAAGAAAAAAGNTMNPWMQGLGAPTHGMPPSQNDMNAVVNMLDNPMVQQMMEQMMNSNPDMFRQMMEAQNPMMAQMFRNNPEAANNFMRTMMNPNVLRSMMQVQQSFSNAGLSPQAMSSAATSNTVPSSPAGLDFSSLLQQQANAMNANSNSLFGMPPMVPPMQQSPVQEQRQQQQQEQLLPADRYRTQLRSLYEMGFDDEQQCLAALQMTHGNLNRAVDMLLAGEVPAPITTTSDSTPAQQPAPATESSSAAENSSGSSTSPPETDDSSPKDATEKKND